MKKIIKKNKNFSLNDERGQAMLVAVVFFLFISLAIISGLVSPSLREYQNARDLAMSSQSYYLSESGVEDAYFRLKNAKPIGSSTLITLNGSTATTNITNSGYNEKTVTSLGDVLSRQRKSELKLSAGQGVAFNYGVQVGTGGFVMNNNAGVDGNVYSSGNITGAPGVFITGTAVISGNNGTINKIIIGENGIGDAWAKTVTNSTIAGGLYCQTGSGNNKSCNTGRGNAPEVPMPVTEEMITKWKSDAALGGTVSGNLTISSPTSLGPKKITGNLIINKDLTLTGTVYVMGNITTANNVYVSLSPSYGTTGGVLIVDENVDLSNNVVFEGSGSPDTYVLLVTTSACPTTGCASTNAIEVANNVGAVILNAQNGTIHLSNNITLNAVVAKTISMNNNSVINYLSGLADSTFSSGPSGGWNINGWKETQ